MTDRGEQHLKHLRKEAVEPAGRCAAGRLLLEEV